MSKARKPKPPAPRRRRPILAVAVTLAAVAGLLYGIVNEWDWESTGKLASVMGTIKIESRGGQNHAVDRDTIALRYRDAFGELPW